jgi:hypothetical protein
MTAGSGGFEWQNPGALRKARPPETGMVRELERRSSQFPGEEGQMIDKKSDDPTEIEKTPFTDGH